MINSFEFPKNQFPSDFTARKIKNYFSEEEAIKLSEVITEIDNYLHDGAHHFVDNWKFDVSDCSRKTKRKLVKKYKKDSFQASLDSKSKTLTLSVPEKILKNESMASQLQKKVQDAALLRFADLCQDLSKKLYKNSNAVSWRCIIYDTSSAIIDEIRDQLLSDKRGFKVVVHQKEEDEIGTRFYRTKQILEIRGLARASEQPLSGSEVILEFSALQNLYKPAHS